MNGPLSSGGLLRPAGAEWAVSRYASGLKRLGLQPGLYVTTKDGNDGARFYVSKEGEVCANGRNAALMRRRTR